MDRDGIDPIFNDEVGSQILCFDSCDRFMDGCRDCDKIKQHGVGGTKTAPMA
jgi:hypothetical protein